MVKTTANYREARAVELLAQGCNYDQIASALGYANRGTAWRTVRKALHDREVEAGGLVRSLRRGFAARVWFPEHTRR